MISIRDIADDNTSISSTRWAFATIVKFDIVVIAISIISGIIGHFIGKPIDSSFYGSVALLLGLLTGFSTGAKISQGYEHTKDKTGDEK